MTKQAPKTTVKSVTEKSAPQEKNPQKEVLPGKTIADAKKEMAARPDVGPSFPFKPDDLPKFTSLSAKSKLPDGLEIHNIRQEIHIQFKGTILNEIDLLNHYTDLLREAFLKAGMPKWKAFFYVNGKRYVSTL